MQCFFKALCYAATKLTSEIGNAFTRHFTPSPLGEGLGVRLIYPLFFLYSDGVMPNAFLKAW